VIGKLPQLIHLRPRNLSVLIHDEYRAVVDERKLMFGGRKHAILLRDLRVRPAIGKQRKAQAAQRFLECDVRENRIGTDAHDLGVRVGKLGQIFLDCRQLILSNRSEVQGVETDDHVLRSLV
jgi:hypothetical protein